MSSITEQVSNVVGVLLEECHTRGIDVRDIDSFESILQQEVVPSKFNSIEEYILYQVSSNKLVLYSDIFHIQQLRSKIIVSNTKSFINAVKKIHNIVPEYRYTSDADSQELKLQKRASHMAEMASLGVKYNSRKNQITLMKAFNVIFNPTSDGKLSELTAQFNFVIALPHKDFEEFKDPEQLLDKQGSVFTEDEIYITILKSAYFLAKYYKGEFRLSYTKRGQSADDRFNVILLYVFKYWMVLFQDLPVIRLQTRYTLKENAKILFELLGEILEFEFESDGLDKKLNNLIKKLTDESLEVIKYSACDIYNLFPEETPYRRLLYKKRIKVRDYKHPI